MIRFQRLGILLSPDGGKSSRYAKFNAGMVKRGDEVHLLYRFTEKGSNWDNITEWFKNNGSTGSPYIHNRIQYARLNMDGTLREDSNRAVIAPTHPWEVGGCEDPRIVPFEGSYYIFYCAWDLQKTRVAVAKTDDFVTYTKLGIIDNFTSDKDGYMFPERIQGKIAYVHRIAPNIQIDYVDSFEELFSPDRWKDYARQVEQQTVFRSVFPWEKSKLGGSIPPIKTNEGWLFFYHGVDGQGMYHLGAALLDLHNPSKVLARCPYPLLSPEEEYEKDGDYKGVVFPQGAYVHQGELFISYGAGDKYVAMAKVPLQPLVEEIAKYPV